MLTLNPSWSPVATTVIINGQEAASTESKNIGLSILKLFAGLIPAMWVGAGVLATGALIAVMLPFSTRTSAAANAAAEQLDEQIRLRDVAVAHAGLSPS